MSSPASPLGPITLRPVLHERVWGVDALPTWYPQPVPGKPIGEAWLSDVDCVADSGPFEGTTLAELTRRYPQALAGGPTSEFPLLVKTLFPREKLSVQVHPNDEQANAVGQPRGKTECWYILSAEPGATLALGFREAITLDQIREAIHNGTLEDKLQHIPVKAGDMVFVDAGTVHAIGPGMVVLETQEYSDITYRLYDYGRPRPLHIDAGLAVTRPLSDAGLKPPAEMKGFTRLVTSHYFIVDRFKPVAGGSPLGMPNKMQMLFALNEGSTITGGDATTSLTPGSIVLLPAEDIDYNLHVEGEVIRIAQP
jgi:mannose-6-phosphate isomerase